MNICSLLTSTIFWDAVTSVGTLAMAITTVRVIYQNRRHHQDSFKPICVLVPDGGVDPLFRGELLRVIHREPNDPAHGTFAIYCTLKNVGAGPAMNIKLEIRCMSIQGYGVIRALSPIAKGECRGSKDNPIPIPVVFRDQFNETDFAIAEGPLWEIFLEYEDVFGKVFHTRHTKNPQEPWAAIVDGPVPEGQKAETTQISSGLSKGTSNSLRSR